MAKEIQPSRKVSTKLADGKIKVFLGGTIDMGYAERWQTRFIEALEDKDVIIYNPRRDDWDASWTAGSPGLRQQIEWELEAITESDLIVMNFVAGSQSPISLLELGFMAGTAFGARHSSKNKYYYGYSPVKPVLVHCPDGFWKKTNVNLTARRFGLRVMLNEDKLIEGIKQTIDQIQRDRERMANQTPKPVSANRWQ